MSGRTTDGAGADAATHHAGATQSLERTLTLRDLVLFNLVAVLGLRWVATSAKAGPSALVLWLLAAGLFFATRAR